MAHHCVDWTAQPPARKTPLLVLTHGEENVYTVVPDELETLEDIARREFNLDNGDICFLSPCASLCHGKSARITQDVWRHIRPYIGCATVNVVARRPGAVDNRPQDAASETGDEWNLYAKRKLPADADEKAPTDDSSEHRGVSATEDDEGEESSAPPKPRPRVRRRLESEEEATSEQEQDEPAKAPQSPVASPAGQTSEIKKEKQREQSPAASQPAERLNRPDIQIKQEKRTSGSSTQSTHTEPQHEAETPTQGEAEKLMIRVAHRPSNQEAKFMTKSTTSVGKVLAGACKSFGLDMSSATLYLIVDVVDEEGKVENLFPCDKNDTIARAGAERDTESRFLLKMTGDA